MWPRLIAQLVELLRHATRLLPMADNYLSSRRETDRMQSAALAQMTDSLRGDIDKVANSYDGLARQIDAQMSQFATLQERLDLAETRSMTQIKQLEWVTSDLNTLRVWVKFGTVAIVLLLAVVIALTIQILHGR